MFENIKGAVGEIREDIETGTLYRYDGSVWNVNMTKSPSSASFPTTNVKKGEVRTDKASGYKYKFNGTSWVFFPKAGDSDEDGTPDGVEADSISTAMLKNSSVTVAKTTISSANASVAISGTGSGALSIGTGKTILGAYPVGLSTAVASVVYSGSTVTVTLTGATSTAGSIVVVYAS